jgi:hypothetical protein
MLSTAFLSATPSPLAAALSTLIPGLGQALQGRVRPGLLSFGLCVGLIAVSMAVGRLAGAGAELFLFMLVVFPAWVFQLYDAYLASAPAPGTLRRTWSLVWRRAHDIRYLGALFLASAVMDLYIILKQPDYALSVFCTKPVGLPGLFFKVQSPTIHTFIGYGFLRLRRWALVLYLAYASFGLINAMANFACFGYGRVRTAFFITLIGFTAYVWLRRGTFRS